MTSIKSYVPKSWEFLSNSIDKSHTLLSTASHRNENIPKLLEQNEHQSSEIEFFDTIHQKLDPTLSNPTLRKNMRIIICLARQGSRDLDISFHSNCRKH